MIMEKRQEWVGVGVMYTKIVATTPTMNRIPTEDYRKITRKGNWNWMLLAEEEVKKRSRFVTVIVVVVIIRYRYSHSRG